MISFSFGVGINTNDDNRFEDFLFKMLFKYLEEAFLRAAVRGDLSLNLVGESGDITTYL
jgi:hypothetical protein